MIGAVERYLAQLELHLLEREMAGGELSEDAEDRSTRELDICWAAMNNEEVEEAERRFAKARDLALTAPVDLGAEDSLATTGILPRRAA
jgi:hypothetical protein